jgi:hypothetical protein
MISITIHASVGEKGKNLEKDVKTITALINVYRRSLSQTSIAISTKSSIELETAIGEFQTNHLKAKDPDKRVDAGGKTFLTLKQYYRGVFKPTAITAPTYGEVTWESEGAEGGVYHSRCFTVPSTASGLTIGRGYDMKEKTQKKISEDMTSIGLTPTQADTIKKAAGLSGGTAGFFVIENDLLDFQLTPDQQLALFKISYDEQAAEVKRICEVAKNEKDYGKVDWATLNSAIKDITIDLKFRGDYTPSSRKNIQKSIADNDLKEFKKQLKDSTNWTGVPSDRFDRRVKFLDKN